MNSVLSFSGLVSSNLKFTGEENVFPKPKFKQIDLACPICKNPFGSGGNLNLRSLLSNPLLKSFLIICSRKFSFKFIESELFIENLIKMSHLLKLYLKDHF